MCTFRVRAHLALKEGLKANYDSWHMWENFLVVSLISLAYLTTHMKRTFFYTKESKNYFHDFLEKYHVC